MVAEKARIVNTSEKKIKFCFKRHRTAFLFFTAFGVIIYENEQIEGEEQEE